MPPTRPFVVALFMTQLALVGACAGSQHGNYSSNYSSNYFSNYFGNYHSSWAEANPDWVVTFPDEGTGLHETLAGLQAPTPFDHRLVISKLAVLRIEEDGVEELSPEEVKARLGEPSRSAQLGNEDLAIVVNVDCRSKTDMDMYAGQRVSWLLLEAGGLSAWDLHLFGSRCVFWNEFRPAKRDGAGLEDRLRAYRRKRFPAPVGNPGEYYDKGLVYVRQGRLPAAEEMLALGDQSFTGRSADGVRFSRPSDKVQLRTNDDDAHSRARLEDAIDQSKGLKPGSW